jgi:hypothetical protein
MKDLPPTSLSRHETISANHSGNAIEYAEGLEVELMTGAGCIWRGRVSAVEVQLSSGSLDVSSPSATYLQLAPGATLRLRCNDEYLAFQLEDAIASLLTGKLTVIAKAIFPRIGDGVA